MALIPNMPAAARRDLHLFYVLDTSGSMRGLAIQRLNRAMQSSLDAVRQVALVNGNANVKVAVLEFNSNWRWMQASGPEDAEDFLWEDMVAAGLTNIGAALDELNRRLSKDQFLNSATGALMPVIIFMTDGFATDDYESALARISQNSYFRGATRVGFAIGDNPDLEMISALAGTPEAVIRTDDLGLFANLLRFVSEGVSQRASVVRGQEQGSVGPEVVHNAMQRLGVVTASDGVTTIRGGSTLDSLSISSGSTESDSLGGQHVWDEPIL